MVLPSAIMDSAGQKNPYTGLGTLFQALSRKLGSACCLVAYLKRWKQWGTGWGCWLHCHPEAWLLPESMSAFMTLMQSQSVLISLTPDAMNHREDRAVQSCLPPLAATLGRTCPTPHRLKHTEERVLHFTWQHNRADCVWGPWVIWPWGHEDGRAGYIHLVCHVVVCVRERCPPRLAPCPPAADGGPDPTSH